MDENKNKAEQHYNKIVEKNKVQFNKAIDNIDKIIRNIDDKNDQISVILDFFHIKTEFIAGMLLPEKLEFLDKSFDIKTHSIILEDKWYKTLMLPMMAETTDGTWVAVIPDAFGRCRYFCEGKYHKIGVKEAARFLPEAICFSRGFGNGRIQGKDLYKKVLQCVTIQDWCIVLFLSILAILAGLILPVVNSIIFEYILPAGKHSSIFPIGALLLGTISVSVLMTLLQGAILSNVLLKIGVFIQAATFSRILKLKTKFYQDKKSGELAELIGNFTDVTNLISVKSITAAVSLVLSFVFLIQMAFFAQNMMPAVFAVTVVFLVVQGIIALQQRNHNIEYTFETSRMSGFIYELFSGIEKVKLNGAETIMFSRWSRKYLKLVRKSRKPFVFKYQNSIEKTILIGATAGIFYLGTRSRSVSDYIAFMSSYGAYIGILMEFSTVLDSIFSFQSASRFLRPMLEAETETYEGSRIVKSFQGNFRFSDVSFRYNADQPLILDHLDFSVQKGESLGIVGRSGSGKSTIIKLLLGFETPERGNIFADDYNLKELDLKSLRKQMGSVLQESKLIRGDIYSNIALTKPDADLEQVMMAVERAGLTEEIADMPMGLHTLISEENCTLSGGQRQRVLIARALLNNPSVLIFDEATSALDNITQEKISSCINELKCTRIIVAHRISTIQHCDRILVMDKGRIAESGSFHELIKRNGIFTELVKNQLITEEM